MAANREDDIIALSRQKWLWISHCRYGREAWRISLCGLIMVDELSGTGYLRAPAARPRSKNFWKQT